MFVQIRQELDSLGTLHSFYLSSEGLIVTPYKDHLIYWYVTDKKISIRKQNDQLCNLQLPTAALWACFGSTLGSNPDFPQNS